MSWRDLPEGFGDFRVVHPRFRRWAKRGVWKKLFAHLAQDADNEATLRLQRYLVSQCFRKRSDAISRKPRSFPAGARRVDGGVLRT
jgi:transposase